MAVPNCVYDYWKPSTFFCMDPKDQAAMISGILFSCLGGLWATFVLYNKYKVGCQRLVFLEVDLKHLTTGYFISVPFYFCIRVAAITFLIDKIIRLHHLREPITIRALCTEVKIDHDKDRNLCELIDSRTEQIRRDNSELRQKVEDRNLGELIDAKTEQIRRENAELRLQVEALSRDLRALTWIVQGKNGRNTQPPRHQAAGLQDNLALDSGSSFNEQSCDGESTQDAARPADSVPVSQGQGDIPAPHAQRHAVHVLAPGSTAIVPLNAALRGRPPSHRRDRDPAQSAQIRQHAAYSPPPSHNPGLASSSQLPPPPAANSVEPCAADIRQFQLGASSLSQAHTPLTTSALRMAQVKAQLDHSHPEDRDLKLAGAQQRQLQGVLPGHHQPSHLASLQPSDLPPASACGLQNQPVDLHRHPSSRSFAAVIAIDINTMLPSHRYVQPEPLRPSAQAGAVTALASTAPVRSLETYKVAGLSTPPEPPRSRSRSARRQPSSAAAECLSVGDALATAQAAAPAAGTVVTQARVLSPECHEVHTARRSKASSPARSHSKPNAAADQEAAATVTGIPIQATPAAHARSHARLGLI